MSVSRAQQSFQRATGQLARQAQQTGKNVGKKDVEESLKLMTADGKISAADRATAEAFLKSAPLTKGAREVLENFINASSTPSGGGGMSPWATRLGGATRTGGGESSRPTPAPAPTRRTGGSEGGHISRGGGSYGGGRSGGGE